MAMTTEELYPLLTETTPNWPVVVVTAMVNAFFTAGFIAILWLVLR